MTQFNANHEVFLNTITLIFQWLKALFPHFLAQETLDLCFKKGKPKKNSF